MSGLTKAKNLFEKAVGLAQALVDLIPVHHVPPGFQVVRTAVLVFQVIGVLPNVIAEDGKFAVRNRIVLVWSGGNLELPRLSADQPGPAAAELIHSGGLKLFLKRVKAAECFVDGVGDRAGRIA